MRKIVKRCILYRCSGVSVYIILIGIANAVQTLLPTLRHVRVVVSEKLPILVIHAKHNGGRDGLLAERRKDSSIQVLQTFPLELAEGTSCRDSMQHLDDNKIYNYYK